jgi:hypothetical protein
VCAGQLYELVSTFKHDFFAATGLYRGPSGLTVLKLGRETDLLSVPLDWIGRLLTRHEAGIYRTLRDVAGVPAFIGLVGDHGFMHAYVAGHPLARREPVPDGFFDDLGVLLATLHARDIAYVDLNKRQNILMGDDRRPYLIDFQISLRLAADGSGRRAPLRWLLRRFQQADTYHCLKHKRRLRPDLLTPLERQGLTRLSIWIRLHRLWARPLTQLRRAVLRRLRPAAGELPAGSAAK